MTTRDPVSCSGCNDLHRLLAAEQEKTARLTQDYERVCEALTCVLEERPLDGSYVHLGYCNSSGRHPAGTRGVTCNCKVGTARWKDTQAKLEAAEARLSLLGGYVRHRRSYGPDGDCPAFMENGQSVGDCTCGLKEILARVDGQTVMPPERATAPTNQTKGTR